MKIEGSVALVTGANRGLGRAIAAALVAGGAKKVYAGARDASTVTLEGVVPTTLDVTNEKQIAAAAEACRDVTLVVNNAGIAGGGPLLAPTAPTQLRELFETNVLGMLNVTRAFAPILAVNGGGVVVDLLSIASWLSLPGAGSYSVSKAAAWSLTNGLRHELRGQGTRVIGVHLAFMDTEMVAHVKGPKIDPSEVARQILGAIAGNEDEVIADEPTRDVKAGLSAAPPSYLG